MSSYERDPTTGNLSLIDGMRSLDEVKALMLDLCYPIGSMYISTVNTSPATFLGGTWIRHEGYVLRAATSGVTANSAVKDLGNDTHTLTVNEMPSHSHGLNNHTHSIPQLNGTAAWVGGHAHGLSSFGYASSGSAKYTVGWGYAQYDLATDGAGGHSHSVTTDGSTTGGNTDNTASAGSGTAMSLIPNEKNVYMWERVS